MILVSACLLGVDCKYSGGNNKNEKIMKYLKGKTIIPVCPEQLGGLTTPRLPSEIVGGTGENVINNNAKVITKNNEDVTKEFVKGAYETLKIAKMCNCSEAILKANSPSCGSTKIYDGTFNNNLIDGMGATAYLLKKENLNIKSEKDF